MGGESALSTNQEHSQHGSRQPFKEIVGFDNDPAAASTTRAGRAWCASQISVERFFLKGRGRPGLVVGDGAYGVKDKSERDDCAVNSGPLFGWVGSMMRAAAHVLGPLCFLRPECPDHSPRLPAPGRTLELSSSCSIFIPILPHPRRGLRRRLPLISHLPLPRTQPLRRWRQPGSRGQARSSRGRARCFQQLNIVSY